MKKILYFSAVWCGPCNMMSNIINELSSEINIEKIDVDKFTDLTRQYGIKSIPTFVLIEDEIEKGRIIGAQSKKSLENFYTS
jgi:thioredoxin 1